MSLVNEGRLTGVNADLIRVVQAAAKALPFDLCVVEGVRTKARQAELYAQGRTKPGKIVTWTMQSKHILGRAVDLAPYVGGKIDWNDLAKFRQINKAMMAAAKERDIQIRWGRDWDRDGVEGEKGEYDGPHWELVG